MEWWQVLIDVDRVRFPVALLRLLAAAVMGGMIGFEREHNDQPAGFKTHIVISTGASLLMIVSVYLPLSLGDGRIGDPGRIAAQVVSGIGFLGAGAMIRMGLNVKGVTTAASIWTVAAIGLAAGAGLILEAGATAILLLFVLTVLDRLEKRIITRRDYRALVVGMKGSRIDLDLFRPVMDRFGIRIKTMNLSQSMERKTVRLRLLVKIPREIDYDRFLEEMKQVQGVYRIDIRQEL